MSDAIVSASGRHYAAAAFGVAQERGDFDAWLAALDNVADAMTRPTTRLALASPAVSADNKKAALDQFVPGAPPYVRNFLHLLVERGRLGEVRGIADAFRERLYNERGVLTADVTTAVPLDPDLERTVAQRIGQFARHDPGKVQIRTRVDPTIIGGVVARVGDTLIDDSVRGRLERLGRALATGRG